MSVIETPKDNLPFDNGKQLPNGQFERYAVLPEAERAKGFVRPFRDAYKHIGVKPTCPLRDLTPEEQQRYAAYRYVKFEAYPESRSPVVGRYWTEDDLQAQQRCGTVTTMGRELSETYARDPGYYGSTFCCACGKHFPVAEFVWVADGEVVGS